MADTQDWTDAVEEAAAPPAIAIIGMSGRFPGAQNLDEFWDNLVNGRDSITRFSVADLADSGLEPGSLSNPNYIRAKGVLENSLSFDAPFFGYSPREAEIVDPQQRVFLECAVAALEDAGCDPQRFGGSIGVYGGQSLSTYMLQLIMDPSNRELDANQISIGNDKDFLTSKVSYKLNLSGPSVVVQSACSTSLVAVSLACQSLIDYGCDVALAGGVCIAFPEKQGYVHEAGGTTSPDGYCRAFDAKESGIVGGNGVGVVVLKRLEDAIADRDNIHAVIRAAAVNNDGSVKVGYTAPGVDGQAEAAVMAQALAEIDPASITYVEAHGTATRLGDPIEIAALTKAFRRKTTKTQYCGVGSVKTNIGHLDAAAGVAGLIKAALALKHRFIPPTLNFATPNPEIEFDKSPFYVCDKPAAWPQGDGPRRAAVSSFGIGGTNAHVILEEAPAAPTRPKAKASTERVVLTLSAQSSSALDRNAASLATFLRREPAIDIADAAHTLQLGRRAYKHRLAIVARTAAEAADLLEGRTAAGAVRGQIEGAGTRVVFLFPGQGAQHIGMMRGLYDEEPAFRDVIDRCADLLQADIGVDLRTLLFETEPGSPDAAALDQTRLTQPALFAVEYALATLWMSWGVEPAGMLGHSIGEYVAACVAGVMDLPDALRLVARRGALMQSLPGGDMASVSLPREELEPLIGEGVSLAGVLGPKLCVVSGRPQPVAELGRRLAGHGIEMRPIRTSHAFHSADMEPILSDFVAAFAGLTLHPPKIPFVSNLTGTWITDAEATSPDYWAQQLRQMVRLEEGLAELTAAPGTVAVEVGPGRSLSALAHQAVPGRRITTVASCRDARETTDDDLALRSALARVWVSGGSVDWAAISAAERRRKVSLPTYSFDRTEYSLLPSGDRRGMGPEDGHMGRRAPSDLLFVPTWRQETRLRSRPAEGSTWLVFLDALGLGSRCAARLRELGHAVSTVALEGAAQGAETADHRLRADDAEAYASLVATLTAAGPMPDHLLHLWGVTRPDAGQAPLARVRESRKVYYDSLICLARAMAAGEQAATGPIALTIVSSGLHDVLGGEDVDPDKALLIGPCRVIPTEYQRFVCKSLDLATDDAAAADAGLIDAVLAEADHEDIADVALRRGRRWTRGFEPLYFNPHGDPPPSLPSRLKQNGTYLITGGLGGLGLAMAEHLADKVGARLVLTGRSPVPAAGDPSGVSERLDAIRAAGSDVMVAQADVADLAAMRKVVAEAVERFGAIDGVVHTAGIADRSLLAGKTPADETRVLAPKVEGTLVLDEVLAGMPLDFLVCFSSVSSLIGAPGQTEYVAANAWLDGFAARRRNDGRRILAINWDRWGAVGMAAREDEAHMAATQGQPPFMMPSLDPADGVAAFDFALDAAEPQIAVALGRFDWITRYGPPRPMGGQPPQADAPTQRRGHQRPEIDTSFVAPGNDIESRVAALFTEVLGIEGVGIDDNFFDLGGHSLLGVRLVNRIQEAFGVKIGIGELFGMPSVRMLGQAIMQRSAGTVDAPASPVPS